MLRAAATHEGASLVEIYQNCPVFNDGAFSALTEKDARTQTRSASSPASRSASAPTASAASARAADGGLAIVDVADVGEDALLVHDPHREDPGLAFALARLAEDPTGPTPIGIFRDVDRPVFGRTGPPVVAAASDEELAELVLGGDTWSVA